MKYQNNILLLLILTHLFVLNFSKGPLTCGQVSWQDDPVPDGVKDDPPLNDVGRSREGGKHCSQAILDKWGSQQFSHFFCYTLLRTVKRCSKNQTT